MRGAWCDLEGFGECSQFYTLGMGPPLQRLFSTFPDGLPGFGLLLLRLGAGIALISFGIMDGSFPDLFAAALAFLLLAGTWTPVVAGLIAIDQLWIVFFIYALPRDGRGIHILLAVLTAAVAMLGPGAFSIDARRFGRKRFL